MGASWKHCSGGREKGCRWSFVCFLCKSGYGFSKWGAQSDYSFWYSISIC